MKILASRFQQGIQHRARHPVGTTCRERDHGLRRAFGRTDSQPADVLPRFCHVKVLDGFDRDNDPVSGLHSGHPARRAKIL